MADRRLQADVRREERAGCARAPDESDVLLTGQVMGYSFAGDWSKLRRRASGRKRRAAGPGGVGAGRTVPRRSKGGSIACPTVSR